jgi:hypothetical protein
MEDNFQSKNINIGYKLTHVIGLGTDGRIVLGTHQLTYTDIQRLRHEGWEGLGPHP